MTRSPDTATGVTRRRRRLSDAETADRMLNAAIGRITESGLTVSLEHLSLEDVIRDAGVSRSAAYRRWPYKDLFFSDLLVELARHATPATDVRTAGGIETARQTLMDNFDRLATPDGRQSVYIELFRTATDVDILRSATEWRSYIALHATFLSLTDGELRTEVQRALADSERGFVRRLADSHSTLAELLGYRIRPSTGADFDTLAELLLGLGRGLAIAAQARPELATARLEAAPAATRPADWSIPGLGISTLVMGFVEPDPDVVWDDARLDGLRDRLTAEPGR